MSEHAIEPTRDETLTRAETAAVDPAKTSVRDIMARVQRDNGYGLRESEVRKLALHVRMLEMMIARRPVGWYADERTYLIETGVLTQSEIL